MMIETKKREQNFVWQEAQHRLPKPLQELAQRQISSVVWDELLKSKMEVVESPERAGMLDVRYVPGLTVGQISHALTLVLVRFQFIQAERQHYPRSILKGFEWVFDGTNPKDSLTPGVKLYIGVTAFNPEIERISRMVDSQGRPHQAALDALIDIGLLARRPHHGEVQLRKAPKHKP